MKLLLTGITGFLGSHLATALLADPAVRIAALVRADDATQARARVRTALATAAHDQGLAAAPDLHQVTVIPVSPGPTSADTAADTVRWCDRTDWRAWAATTVSDDAGRPSAAFEVVHCAANLSFKAEDKAAVFEANVDGTRALLDALRGAPVACFNYVSTAYVAGRESGRIAADRSAAVPVFNNPYEESKFVTERLVADHAARTGMPFRCLRPSIIVGHSRTFRSSSTAGFFKVLAQLSELARKGPATGAQVRLPVPGEATLDMVPIDAVVAETVALLASGPATHGMTFHLTCEEPLRTADIFRTCSPQTGIELVAHAEDGAPTALDRLVGRSLKHYLPYLGLHRSFDRTNLHACGAAQPAASAGTSLDLLLQISRTYLAQVAAPVESMPAAPPMPAATQAPGAEPAWAALAALPFTAGSPGLAAHQAIA